MTEGQDAAVTVAVDGFEAAGKIVQLDGVPVPDLERAILTAAIDLKAVRMIVWSFHCSAAGTEFSSPECRQLWRWLLIFSRGHAIVPTRKQVREAFPFFRFVRAPFPLLQMASRVFKTPRVVRSRARTAPASDFGCGRRVR